MASREQRENVEANRPKKGAAVPSRVFGASALLLSGALILSPAAQAQNSVARTSMEQCVERVLTRLSRAKASEKEVGPAIISGCDGPLRAAVADAIKTGEAAICANVESCMSTARQRAADEAKLSYRERVRR